MSADQIILLVAGLIVIAAVAATVAYATAFATRGTQRRAPADRARGARRDHHDAVVDPSITPATNTPRMSASFLTPASTRQVARVVAFLFLAAVAVVVALTRAWPDDEPAHPAAGVEPGEIVQGAVIEGDFVVRRDIVVTAEQPRGVWLIADVPVADLFHLVRKAPACDPERLAEALGRSPEQIVIALAWLRRQAMIE